MKRVKRVREEIPGPRDQLENQVYPALSVHRVLLVQKASKAQMVLLGNLASRLV